MAVFVLTHLFGVCPPWQRGQGEVRLLDTMSHLFLATYTLLFDDVHQEINIS